MLDRNRLLATLVVGALFAPPAVHADDPPVDRTPVDCIILSRIDKTDIIDDQTVLFFMRGRKQIYQNYLPRKCPGLEAEDRFSYQARSSQLCKVDLITVLPRVGIPTTCRLGQFQPITAEEVAELHAIHDRQSDGVDVKPVAPPEEPAAGDAPEPEAAKPRE